MTPTLDTAKRWFRTRGHDRDAQTELTGRSLPLPDGLGIEWLGTAGYRITHEGRSILIDPYFTRKSLGDVAKRRTHLPDPALVDRYLADPGDVIGVLVGHTHFDHAVDTPAIVRRFGCPAYGSTSLAHLMGLHGLGERTVTVEPQRDVEIGPFTVRFVPSVHSKLIAGLKIPSEGELCCEHLDALTSPAYRCGQVWGIRIEVPDASGGTTVLYHQGSADVIEDEVPTDGVDIFLAGIAGRYAAPGYVATMLRLLQPDVVVPGHYDDFFRPLDADMGFSLNVNLAAFVDEVERVAPGVTLAGLHPLTPVGTAT